MLGLRGPGVQTEVMTSVEVSSVGSSSGPSSHVTALTSQPRRAALCSSTAA